MVDPTTKLNYPATERLGLKVNVSITLLLQQTDCPAISIQLLKNNNAILFNYP